MVNWSSVGEKVPASLMLPGQFGLLVERQERHPALDRVLQHRGEHERPVDFQRRLALLERQPRGALVGLGDRRVGARRGGHRLDDLQRLDRRRPMLRGVGQRDGLAVIGKHLSASAFQQRVEPHHQALVLLGLHRDPAGLALGVQPGRLGDHPVPGVRRRSHQICSVPEQLGIGGDGCGIELALPLGGFQRAGQGVVGGVGLGLPGGIVGKRQRPTGLGELRGPHHVERHHIEGAVVAGQPARQLQPLIVGGLGQAELLDAEPAAELVVAALGDGGERRGLAGRCVEADDHAVVAGAACRHHRGGGQRGHRGGAHPPSARARACHDNRLPSSRPWRNCPSFGARCIHDRALSRGQTVEPQRRDVQHFRAACSAIVTRRRPAISGGL